MSYLIGFLSIVLFFNCLLLILLILVQLPKKDAGMGSSFGGAGADALFGAGAGNTMTKLTKWGTVLFLCLALLLSVLNSGNRKGNSAVRDQLASESGTAGPIQLPATGLASSNAAVTNATVTPGVTNVGFGSQNVTPVTNAITNTILITNAANAVKSGENATLQSIIDNVKVSADTAATKVLTTATNAVKAATNAVVVPPAKKN
ncbi:MAG: preprotein translocase subunit SecG [Verrucomicrobiia bacterium]|jgi:protein translocase SecG subunit